MYTQCPECGTVFRVTAAVLRAAQARVRCGVCDANFNALQFLSDDLEADAGAARDSADAALLRPHSSPAPAEPTPFPPATRHTPSADEARAFRTLDQHMHAPPPAGPTAATTDFNVLEPEDVDASLLQDEPAATDDADASLEFNVPASDWERFFTPAESATPVFALDLNLLPTRADPGDPNQAEFLLAAEPPTDPALVQPDAPTTEPIHDAEAEAGLTPETEVEFEVAAGPAPEAEAEAEPAPAPAPESEPEVESEVKAEVEPAPSPEPPHAANAGDVNAAEVGLSYARLLTDDGDAIVAAELPTDPELNWPTPPLASSDEVATVEAPAEQVDDESHAETDVRAGVDFGHAPPPATAPEEAEFDVDVDLDADLAFALLAPREPATAADDASAHTDEFGLEDFTAHVPLPFVDELPLSADAPAAREEEEPILTTAVAAEPIDDAHEPLYEHPALESGPALAADAFNQPPARPAPSRAPLQWVAAVALALALAAQLIHHERETLIDKPIIGSPLAGLYSAFGAPIEPRWNLGDYEVRQWGSASEEAPGELRLRASIVNHAGRGQPYPLLRVLLEDRFGGTVARREFRPAEYLPGHSRPRGPLSPGARADADLRIADPGNQAVGFELDVCLERHGVLTCGADPRAAGT